MKVAVALKSLPRVERVLPVRRHFLTVVVLCRSEKYYRADALEARREHALYKMRCTSGSKKGCASRS